MEPLAKALYFQNRRNRADRLTPKKPGRPLFFYIAYSHLLRACVSEGRGDYKSALQYTYAYADLSWVKETDEDTLHWKHLFKEWAEANTFANKLFAGDFEVLHEYVTFLEKNPDEILLGLYNIMGAANRFQYNVDDILAKFDEHIKSYLEDRQEIGHYSDKAINQHILYLLYELAYYYLTKKANSNGLKYLLECVTRSFMTKNKSYLTKCMMLLVSHCV
jgi:hypothetical protein